MDTIKTFWIYLTNSEHNTDTFFLRWSKAIFILFEDCNCCGGFLNLRDSRRRIAYRSPHHDDHAGRKLHFRIQYSCRNRFVKTVFGKGAFLSIRLGSTNCGIRFKRAFFLFEQAVIRTTSADPLSGFCSRCAKNSVHSRIPSETDCQR